MSDTHDKILETALELFSRQGCDAVSIRDICTQVGIKESSVYYHFKNKRAIALELYSQFEARSLELMERLASALESGVRPERSSYLKVCAIYFDNYLCDSFCNRVLRLLSVGSKRFLTTKVDRSGAYMCRYIAKNIVAAGLAEKCLVTLAYGIGMAQPVMVQVDTYGTGTVCADDCIAAAIPLVFGLTPRQIIEQLHLQRPIFAQTAVYGHFGRKELPWERTDKAKALRATVV